jgi:tetratricopeptide (TPR) repeat protein
LGAELRRRPARRLWITESGCQRCCGTNPHYAHTERANAVRGRSQGEPTCLRSIAQRNFFEQTITRESEQKALQYYRQSAELDPSFARAYVGIARSYNYLVDTQVVPVGESTAASDAAIAKALELDPDLGEAYAGRGWTLLRFHWDFPGAERDFRHALELDPSSSTAHEGLAGFFVAMSRLDEGLKEMSRAEDLDPLSSRLNTNNCQMLRFARRLDDAIAKCNAAVELAPNYWWALDTTGEVYEEKGAYAEAHKFWATEGFDASFMAMADELHRVPGVKGAFDAWLKRQRGHKSHSSFLLPTQISAERMRLLPGSKKPTSSAQVFPI